MDKSQSQHQYNTTGREQPGRIDLDNYIPDPNKSNILKSRLYDSGISNIPMPSVKRPIEEKISSKPFSARMNSSKIQSLSPLKKKIQDLNTAIIENLNQSYQYAAAQEAKYLGEGKAEYYRKQQVIIPANSEVPTSVAGRKLQGRMGVSIGQPRMTGQLLNTRKSNQLAPLENEYQEKISQQFTKTHIMDPARIMSGPPSLVYAGFEGGASLSQQNLEKARSKFLVDKLTGKLPQRPPHLLEPIAAQQETTISKTLVLSTEYVDKGETHKDKKEKKVQTWTDLDKYIELLLESRTEEETVFQYLNPSDKGNPYDLQVVVFGRRKQEKYYTLSGKGITQYGPNGPVEFLSLGQWLLERDSYKHIRDLDFFKQFKKWKFMRMWKKNIKLKKRSTASGLLEAKLFYLQDHFHEALLKHRKMMLDMSQKKFIDNCAKAANVLNKEEYYAIQLTKQEQCKTEIEKISENSRANVRDCINKVTKELRDRITGEIYLDETRKQQPNQNQNTASMKRKETSDVFTKLNFPPGMTYGHRSQLRKECIKFLRFAYLVDFLSMESLAKIYTNSVADMIQRLKKLDESGTERLDLILKMDFDDSGPQANQAPRGLMPLFYVSVMLNDTVEIDPEEIKQEPIDDFVLPPRGTSKIEDFDLIAHIEEEAEVVEDESDGSDAVADMDEEFVQKYRQVVPNIHDKWIQLAPKAKEFKTLIGNTFQAGLICIKSSFVRWNKHIELLDFSKILEDWDWEDTVGDDWDTPEQQCLNPDTWINNDPIYKTKQDEIDTIVDNAYKKSSQFLYRFQPLLQIYWRNKQFTVSRLLLENLKGPVESLQNTLKLLKFYHTQFQSKLPASTDIGLLQLDSRAIKDRLLPTPKQIIEKIEKDIPEDLRKRLQKAHQWLNISTEKIKKIPSNVEEFVVQLGNLKEINEKFQNYRDSVSLIEQMLEVIAAERDTGPKVMNKDDALSLKNAQKIINDLTSEIQKVESTEELQKDKFKKELDRLIPALVADVTQLKDQSVEPKYLDITSDQQQMIKELDEKWYRYTELSQTSEKFNRWQVSLETGVTQFNIVQECYDQLFYRKLLWNSRFEWKELAEKYKQSLFMNINDKEISKECDKYSKISGQLERALEPNEIQVELKQLVENYKDAMPIVSALRNQNLKEDHWKEIREIINKPSFNVEEEGYTLEKLLEENVTPFQEQICSISARATGESKLKQEYEQILAQWNDINFKYVAYTDKYNKLIEFDKMYDILDQLISAINMVLANRYVTKLRSDSEVMKKKLTNFQECYDQWVYMQKTWMYMEKIFGTSSQDIKNMLPIQHAQFQNINKFWETLMSEVTRGSTVATLMKKRNSKEGNKQKDFLKDLMEQNAILDEIDSKLKDYLETKCVAFPRFYFLSFDEVLDIIASSGADQMDKVQGMLNKIFDGLTKLELNDQQQQMFIAMISKEGEKVFFKTGIKTNQTVENQLNNIQSEMKSILARLLDEGYKTYDQTPDRAQWVVGSGTGKPPPGQVVATMAQIKWTEETENALSAAANDITELEKQFNINSNNIKDLAKLVANPDLASLPRHILVALITTDVHARDIVQELWREQITSVDDFTWKKQLRYYYELDDQIKAQQPTKNCRIEQVQATLQYGHEYMGATSRLVITPLTDRCWITISMALHIQRGANPAGPAGTGKTESTKDLAKAIALFCYVFNCSDQVDYHLVGKLFSGLCQQGCWACLDEFNRIDIEVLSVIAQQLLTVRNALIKLKSKSYTKEEHEGEKKADDEDKFFFEGREIKIKPEFGCHITMNPGYAGRTELPDNLKILFRPVAMMVPSYQLIAEVMLGAEGFQNSKNLSEKMVQLYKLSSEQLSQQSHYDFGMRAVKSVLVMAGSLKRANQGQDERDVLIRAMKDANVPKFLQQDLPLFLAIVQDLFPEAVIMEPDYSEFLVQLEESLDQKGLQSYHKVFKSKVIQLLETFNVRFGVMLVGLTGSGKTTCYEILAEAMSALRRKDHKNQMYQKISYEIINPKAITMGELYGEVDLSTQEWSDGLASMLMRAAAAQPQKGYENDRIWTVFDGPVDALWIENMNTVLDDNQTLCLSNGQRIKLRKEMNMLFEVQDLQEASPATVSRCGMVYLTAEEMGWKPFVQSWIKKQYGNCAILGKELQEHLWDLFEHTVDIGFERIRTGLKEPIKTTNLQQVKGLCAFLQAFLDPEKGFKGDEKQKKKDLECLFAFSYAWGLGASLDAKGKDVFDSTVRDQFKSCQFPGVAFNYFYDLKKDKCFKEWSTKVDAFVFDKNLQYFELIVPTETTYAHRYCLETLLAVEKPCFFTGDSGVGKSVIVSNTLEQLFLKQEDNVMPIYINFSAQTNSGRTQQNMLAKMEKMRQHYQPPPIASRIAIFVDDVNMPAVEQYGAQPPIELLRLFLNQKGVYERSDWTWKEVRKATLIAAAAPPSGSRADLTPRFMTHFNMFALPPAEEEMLKKIFSSILRGFLKTGFSEKVQQQEDAAVNSTITVYQRISSELRATPQKFHYTFNLRDVSKVFQGILMTKPASIPSEASFQKLWANETLRVFHDRLIDQEDVNWFIDLMMDLLNNNFKSGAERNDLFGENKIMFGDLLKIDMPGRPYEEIPNRDRLKRVLIGKLEDYNATSDQRMSLVFFDDAMYHVLRICRALRQPRGNLMLIGVGGSGKQSLTKLAASIYEIQYKQIEMKKDYRITDFRDFIKQIMFQTAGVEEEEKKSRPTVFTLTDSQIIDETFLEDISSILNTGEIPNLMLSDDKDKIMNELREVVQKMGKIDTADIILQVFTERVREHFHICLAMSPVGDSLRIRCRQFPSLVNCCTLDWFSRWPAEALLYVSSEFLKEIEMPNEEVRRQVSEMCMIIHTSVESISLKFWDELRRRVYTTPKSYLDLIKLYINKLGGKRKKDNANRDRLALGVKKLTQTNTEIALLKEKLKVLQPQLEIADKDLAIVLEKVAVEKAIADEEEERVSKEGAEVAKQAAEAQAQADEADAELANAKPLIENARKAVDKVDAQAITEVKGFTKPPELCVTVMECIMLFLDLKPDWDTAKREMQNAQEFLKKLKNIKVESLKDGQLKKIRKMVDNKTKWDYNAIKNQSAPAANLSMWAKAMSDYQKAWKIVEPKKAKVAELQKTVEQAQAVLKVKMDKVREVKDKVAKLQQNIDELQSKKADTERQMATSKGRMRRAESLVVLLADEGVRWKNDVEQMNIQITKLVGNVFLACACISYFGAFTGDYRKQLTDFWIKECMDRKIPTSDTFSLPQVLGNQMKIRDWNQKGLPTDNTSAENAILATKAERWGLCIDPQQQANKWLSNTFRTKDLKKIKGFENKDFLRQITYAVKLGSVVLIEDIGEELSPAIDAILLRQEFMIDGQKMIKLGDKNEDYDDNFRLFMTTKMANPEYKPETCIKVTLINFTVTFQGLEEQLLGDVVIKEKPQTENDRQEIITQMAKDQATLKEIEDKILDTLKNSEIEQILDADDLIITLEKSKVTAGEINERMAKATITNETIAKTRASFKSVAVRGSILYFVIADMARINDMYQNSLQFVKMLFNKAIDLSAPSENPQERLDNLINTINSIIYTNICRGLFERDKLIFSFLIATSIDRYSAYISSNAWNIVLRGAMPFTEEQASKKPANPLPKLLSTLMYDIIYSSQIALPSFAGIIQSFEEQETLWIQWATCAEPHTQKLPGDWETKITDFEKLILLKAFRSEKMMFAFQNYIINHLGKFFVESPSVQMKQIYEDMDHETPLVFVLSTGADPTLALDKFAEEMGCKETMGVISLGQGQGEKAIKLITESQEKGNWVLLQNCHLAKSFMPDLERMVVALRSYADEHPNLDEEQLNQFKNFRLFLTSMPADYFPVAVLQNSIKMTTEPPRGIRANLRRTYAEFSDNKLDDCRKPEAFRRLLFGLSFFHAVSQERRKFGPLGFNNVYEFNDSDLETSIQMLKMFLDDQEEIPWDSLNYMTGEINYGGRVTDDWDRRCLLESLKKYYCAENLDDGYIYDEEGVYFCPPTGSLQSYKDYIESLPLVDTPSVFGLHQNANISYQKQESQNIVETILGIQPRVSSSGGGMSPNQLVLERISQLQNDIPAKMNQEDGKKEIFKTTNGLLLSLTTVLIQEMEKFNRLIDVISKSLDTLKEAIYGFVVMSDVLDKMFVKLQNGQVPLNWEKVAYPSLKPLASWYTDLNQRVVFLNDWLINGQPKSYWISGFFFPQGFLTGVLQTHARLHKIPIDELGFEFEVLEAESPDQLDEVVDSGVVIHGFFMDGARWNREEHCIDDQLPSELYSTVPLIHFKPAQKIERNLQNDYCCPAYKTGARKGTLSTTGLSTNMILGVYLPTSERHQTEVWVRRAAALLCQLND